MKDLISLQRCLRCHETFLRSIHSSFAGLHVHFHLREGNDLEEECISTQLQALHTTVSFVSHVREVEMAEAMLPLGLTELVREENPREVPGMARAGQRGQEGQRDARPWCGCASLVAAWIFLSSLILSSFDLTLFIYWLMPYLWDRRAMAETSIHMYTVWRWFTRRDCTFLCAKYSVRIIFCQLRFLAKALTFK